MIKPPRLKKGDTVGICSPSGTIAHKRERFEKAKANFEKETGLQTFVAAHAWKKHYYSAGTPEERLQDFHDLIADENIKAVVFSAGGDTAIDLVDRLDYDLIRQNPKIISGISDATTLLSAVTAKTGLITFLGLELLDFADCDMSYEINSLQKSWFKGEVGVVETNPDWRDLHNTLTHYQGRQNIRPGAASGQLIGGNAESFLQLVDTQYELQFPEAILCLETYKLPKKQIHKVLMQLRLRGVFDRIRGLIIGYCLDCDNTEIVGNDQPLAETILEVAETYAFPIMHMGEMGHYVENFLQPLGARVEMDATKLTFTVLESVTK